MRSRSATERPIGPATGRMASKPGFGSASRTTSSQNTEYPNTETGDGRTCGARKRHARLARLEAKDATIARRDAYAPADVGADTKRGTVRSEQRALAAGGATRGVRGRPGVAGPAPERVDALKGEQRLRHIRLGDDDGARCA